MNILIPTLLSTKKKVGVAEYLIHLIKYLQRFDNKNKYYIVTSIENRKFFDIQKKNFKEIIIPIFDFSRISYRFQYAIFHFIMIPILSKILKIDLVHMPCPWFTFKKIKTITTVHDLTEVVTNKYYNFFNSIKKSMIVSSIRNSYDIITVSDTTKDQIKQIYNRECIRVYNGKNELKSKNSQDLIKPPYELTKQKFFISIGTLLHHKNFVTLIKCFHLFHKENSEFKLVIIGNKDNAYQNIARVIKKLQLNQAVIITGYLEDMAKNYLLKNSLALISVSTNEGFGMTLLEAQIFNVPVIASTLAVHKEILKESALFVNSTDLKEVTNTMKQIANDKLLRKELIQKGQENLKRFSWKNAAKETIKAYDSTIIS